MSVGCQDVVYTILERLDKPMNGLSAALNKRHRSPDKGRMPAQWAAKRVRAKITSGHVGTATGEAFVYVGQSATGRVKAGMTSNLASRAASLKIEMVYFVQVRPESAKEVETELFQLLLVEEGASEWVKHSVDRVIPLLDVAVANVRRRAWVDPHLTEEEARKLRVEMAITPDEAARVVATPNRTTRRIAVLSPRRGTGDHHGA